MFSVLVATVINGKAANFEVSFPATPGVLELTTQCDAVLEEEAQRQGAVFQRGRYQIHSAGEQWVDLVARTQLRDKAQLFVVPSPHPQPVPVGRAPPQYPMSPPPKACRDMAPQPAPEAPQPPPVVTYPSYYPQPPSPPRTAPAMLISPSMAPAATAPPAPSRVFSPVDPQLQAPLPPAPMVPAAAGCHTGLPVYPPQPVPAVESIAEVAAFPDPAALRPLPFEDKVAALFKEIDTDGDGALSQVELRTAFEVFSGVFSRAYMGELARKTCGNEVLTYSGWRAFCEKYPSLTDSMGLRLRTRRAEAERDELLREERHALRDLQEQTRAARQAHDEAVSAARRSEERLAQQADAVAAAAESERLAAAAVHEVRHAVHLAQNDHAAAADAVTACSAVEAEVAAAHASAAGAADDAQRVHEMRYNAHMQALNEEQHATDILLQLRTELDGIQGTIAQSARLRDTCIQAVHEAAAAEQHAVTDVHICSEQLAAAESHVVAVTQTESALAEAYAHVAAERGAVEEAHQHALHAFQQDSFALSEAEHARTQSSRAVEELARHVDVLVAEHTAFNERREEADRRELTLLQQEFDLRAQRESLHAEEQRLLGVHAQFCAHAHIPAVPPARGPIYE